MADLHLVVDRAAGGIAGQIARELREAVRQGRLPAGGRLPASRELARDLGLSRGVVVEAYEQLVAEGLLISRVGAGTSVAPAASRPPGAALRDPLVPAFEPYYGHRSTSPDLSAFPRERWLASIRRALATLPADALDYGDPGGVPALREELADYLRRVRAADAGPDDIVIVGGVAQGLSLTVQALAGQLPEGRAGHDLNWFVDRLAHPVPPPGRIRLAVEDPAGVRQLPLLRAAGADLVAVPVDREGIDVGALAATGARAVLLTPAHQYPTGVVLSPRRRAELIEWAAGTGATILEDDYDAEFRFDRDPVGCLQGLAPGRVVLAGSVSKSLAPGLRLGWVVAPPGIAESVRRARGELDLGSPVLEQYALADLIGNGGYDRHLRRMRREYRARRDAFVRALAEHLPEIRVHGVSAGLHLFAELPGGCDESQATEAAQACGLAAEPVGAMRGTPGPPALVMGFARLPVHRADQAIRAFAAGLRR
ncbi:PLP-dependent aminotransferase family protein [Streptosporangium roseum]|uniref:Transcriptional regulator, GntR family n=1 Tax=Streptosporangium roseum (strain ATCC 12428 / DSM 43021 / JCM 3005 / KCTC 9067 / NCIMB 10171 / NRRL 2505 / NI 9100) TaxID=479432 RepID=D2B2B4_STRRD|nr:PLP-dependent aminotransferase family protein [Streptosporangium roseum]ACZ91140.1 putative transcriptional regulator, GntR family [Streptosporangium roseum DSM 43021]